MKGKMLWPINEVEIWVKPIFDGFFYDVLLFCIRFSVVLLMLTQAVIEYSSHVYKYLLLFTV